MRHERHAMLDNEDETEVVVEYNFYPGSHGDRYDPPYGCEVEIVRVSLASDRSVLIVLTDAEASRIQTTIAENHEADHLASWADDLRDRQRDEAMMEQMAERRAKE